MEPEVSAPHDRDRRMGRPASSDRASIRFSRTPVFRKYGTRAIRSAPSLTQRSIVSPTLGRVRLTQAVSTSAKRLLNRSQSRRAALQRSPLASGSLVPAPTRISGRLAVVAGRLLGARRHRVQQLVGRAERRQESTSAQPAALRAARARRADPHARARPGRERTAAHDTGRAGRARHCRQPPGSTAGRRHRETPAPRTRPSRGQAAANAS